MRKPDPSVQTWCTKATPWSHDGTGKHSDPATVASEERSRLVHVHIGSLVCVSILFTLLIISASLKFFIFLAIAATSASLQDSSSESVAPLPGASPSLSFSISSSPSPSSSLPLPLSSSSSLPLPSSSSAPSSPDRNQQECQTQRREEGNSSRARPVKWSRPRGNLPSICIFFSFLFLVGPNKFKSLRLSNCISS